MILKIASSTSTSCEPQSVPSAGSSATLEIYSIILFLFTGLKKKKKPLLYKSLRNPPPFLPPSPPLFLSSFLNLLRQSYVVAQAGLQQAIPSSIPWVPELLVL